jgi:hypothetical protein
MSTEPHLAHDARLLGPGSPSRGRLRILVGQWQASRNRQGKRLEGTALAPGAARRACAQPHGPRPPTQPMMPDGTTCRRTARSAFSLQLRRSRFQAGPANRLTRRAALLGRQTAARRTRALLQAGRQCSRPSGPMQRCKLRGQRAAQSRPHTTPVHLDATPFIQGRGKRPQPARLPNPIPLCPAPVHATQPGNLAASNRLPESNFSSRAPDLRGTCSTLLATHTLLQRASAQPRISVPISAQTSSQCTSTLLRPSILCPQHGRPDTRRRLTANRDPARGKSHVRKHAASREEEATQERPSWA